MPHPQPQTVAELTDAVLSGAYGPDPKDLAVTSAFWLYHTTRLAGSEVTYHNHYLVLRIGHSFGACSFEAGELAPDFCENASGHTLDTLLRHDATPVRVAALDAYLSQAQPHREADGAEPVALPGGTPEVRARARDASIAGLLDIEPGTRVALIGVVNPLVAAIRERGGVCLPCDLNLRTTQWGEQVADDMTEVLREADAVVATGMTLSNGTFDPRYPEKVTPFEALYTDLRRLGRIFRVEDRADEVVDGLKRRVEAVRAQAPKGDPVPVFLYDSGTDQPFTAGSQVPPTDIIGTAGGRNVFAGLEQRWTQVNWEAVAEAQPEVIMILDYGDQPARKKIEFLRKSPHTKELPAVRKNNFFVLDYNEGISGPRNVDGLEKFATYLRTLDR